MSSLPRGITAVKWKNTTKSKEKVVKYRVRSQKKVDGFPVKLDKLYDSLQEAIDDLNDFKSKAGSYLINKLEKHQQEEINKVKNFLASPPLSYYIDSYVKEKVDTKDQSTQLKKRNVESIKAFFRVISRTEIPDRHTSVNSPMAQSGGVLAMMANQALKNSISGKRKFSQFKVQEISYIEINDYIKERLKTVQKISVSRELSFIKKLFDNLKYFDKSFFNLQNPVPLHDKSLLLNRDNASKNDYRLPDEDKKILFETLENHPNWEMKAICLLSYYCGFRRSEIVSLLWEQVHLEENFVQLYQTKSGQPRKVFLIKEAKEIIEQLPRTNKERLFSYKLMGFSGSFDKMLDTLQEKGFCKGFRFHFFRREAISNLVFNIGQATGTNGSDYSILISELLGINNVRALEKNHISQLPPTEPNSQSAIMKSMGHSNKQTTKRYSRIKVR